MPEPGSTRRARPRKDAALTGRGRWLPRLAPETRALLVSAVIAVGVALAFLAVITVILLLAAALTSGVAA